VSETVQLAVIGIVMVLVQALVLYVTKWQDAKQKRADRQEDYARQDIVADRVREAAVQARVTADRAEEAAKLASAERLAMHEQLVENAEQVKKIHTLVNSDMTAARTAERDSLKLLVIQLKKNISSLSATEKREILDVEHRIEELNQILADRLAAQAKVDEDAAHQKP